MEKSGRRPGSGIEAKLSLFVEENGMVGLEPATFQLPVEYFNHTATSSVYMYGLQYSVKAVTSGLSATFTVLVDDCP